MEAVFRCLVAWRAPQRALKRKLMWPNVVRMRSITQRCKLRCRSTNLQKTPTFSHRRRQLRKGSVIEHSTRKIYGQLLVKETGMSSSWHLAFWWHQLKCSRHVPRQPRASKTQVLLHSCAEMSSAVSMPTRTEQKTLLHKNCISCLDRRKCRKKCRSN